MQAMRTGLAALVLTGLALVAFPRPAAAAADALDELAATLHAREATVDGSTARGRRQVQALRRAARRAEKPSPVLLDDLAALKACARKLARPFRGDAELGAALASCRDALAAAARAERDELAARGPEIDDAGDSALLADALLGFDIAHDDAVAEPSPAASAAALRRAVQRLERAEARLGFGPLPDFRLVDTNEASPTYGRRISPRDFRGLISAWYFGHSG